MPLNARRTTEAEGALVQYIEESGALTRRWRVGRARQQARVNAPSEQAAGVRDLLPDASYFGWEEVGGTPRQAL